MNNKNKRWIKFFSQLEICCLQSANKVVSEPISVSVGVEKKKEL